MRKSLLIILAFAQFGCTTFSESFTKSGGSLWNPGQNDHAFYGPNQKEKEKARHDSIRQDYRDADEYGEKHGWNSDVEDPSDYWFYLNLHQ